MVATLHYALLCTSSLLKKMAVLSHNVLWHCKVSRIKKKESDISKKKFYQQRSTAVLDWFLVCFYLCADF